RPMAPCVVHQACRALAALPALCKTMFRFGHTCQRCQRCLGRPMGEIKVDLHHLCGVVRALTPHDPRLLMAFLALRGARHHPPFASRRSNANWGLEREPLRAWGTPALSRRALSGVHVLGRDSRRATTVGPAPEPSPRARAT